ncbi:hypothetical protein GCK72_019861 [Caenorhabditis remanei]|uniref:Uncharacterized protein n=1 Tax=Caenorhabditis remanei TaxID=31234 RepID=A0A6A5GF39_CAERE|nr:hypothetical protein GCK72_019861 [Caenorhabditis remanei]KAF1753305.1 hypothetical protein GCK72_019861 [Caenorhabditis remanei]
MLVVHLTCFLSDVTMNVLVVPYTFFSAAVGYPMGVLTWFGVLTMFQVYSGFTSVMLLGPALVLFFEDRYNHLVRLDSDTRSRFIKRCIHFGSYYFLTFICMIPLFFEIPSLQNAKKLTYNEFPCLPQNIFEKPGVFMLTSNTGPAMACLFSFFFISACQAFYFTFRRIESKSGPSL